MSDYGHPETIINETKARTVIRPQTTTQPSLPDKSDYDSFFCYRFILLLVCSPCRYYSLRHLVMELPLFSNSTPPKLNPCFLRPSPNYPVKTQILFDDGFFLNIFLTQASLGSLYFVFSLNEGSNKPNLFNLFCWCCLAEGHGQY